MNLWANFDHTDAAASTANSRRSRRLTERAILAVVRGVLLNDYAAAYCRSLAATRIFRRCYWIDALGIERRAALLPTIDTAAQATPPLKNKSGRKSDLLVPPALLPIVALSQRLARQSPTFAFYGYILDAGGAKGPRRGSRGVSVKEAQRNILPASTSITLPPESSIVQSNWFESAPVLLQKIEQAPAIFFLNPCGASLFGPEHLTPLYRRSLPTELCLFISHKQLEAHFLAAQSSPVRASALTALLRTDRWKMIPMQEEFRPQAIADLIELFAKALQRQFLLPVQRIILPIQTEPVRVEAIPYTLIFATRRQDSLICMNDAVYLYNRRVYEQSQQGILGQEWFAAQRQRRQQEELAGLSQRILWQGQSQQARRWPDLRQSMLLANFGKFALHEYDAIMQQLLQNGEVRCEWRQASATESGVPGQDDTLIWRQRLPS